MRNLIAKMVAYEMPYMSQHGCQQQIVVSEREDDYQPDQRVLPSMQKHELPSGSASRVQVEIVQEMVTVNENARGEGRGNG